MFLLPMVSVLPFLAAMTWPPWKTDESPVPATHKAPPVFDASAEPATPKAPMSDIVMPAAPEQASIDKPARVQIAQPQPLESSPISRTTKPGIPIATPLRLVLLNIGADIAKTLVIQGKTPEDMAKDLQMEVDAIYMLIIGRQPDVSIGTLDALAKYLGASLAIHLTLSGN